MSGFNLSEYHRLVIKVGSSLLIGDDDMVHRGWLEGLAENVATLQAHGHEVLIVSSGAIAIGSRVLDINKRRARLGDLQAAAAAGQVQLVHAWQEALAQHDIVAAQVLLTPEDTENRRRFLNARGTLEKLLNRSVVPIINENDTVATEEIRYGDNDRLAARVAQLVMADALILLSDVDGLYTADPGSDDKARHIPEVGKISEEIQLMAGETRSDIGSGGMATKVQAARIATHAGCSTVIASGKIERPLESLAAGGICTVFRAEGTPVGVVEVVGNFRRGDVVTLVDRLGNELGRGLAEYGDDEATRLAGCQSEQIEERLGYRGRSVMVNRDELVLFGHD
jgi:glutamate 5-kinase